MIPAATFAKKERLIKTGDFGKVYRSGRSFKAGFIILRTLPNSLLVNRLGFSISSKSIKGSSGRNRVKRLFREVYRKNKKMMKKGLDMVLVVRKAPEKNFGYADAQKIFLKLTQDAGALL